MQSNVLLKPRIIDVLIATALGPMRYFWSRGKYTSWPIRVSVCVRRETVVFLEQGKYNPSLYLAHNVAKKLKVKIDDLFIF